jgi:hypothetical protein
VSTGTGIEWTIAPSRCDQSRSGAAARRRHTSGTQRDTHTRTARSGCPRPVSAVPCFSFGDAGGVMQCSASLPNSQGDCRSYPHSGDALAQCASAVGRGFPKPPVDARRRSRACRPLDARCASRAHSRCWQQCVHHANSGFVFRDMSLAFQQCSTATTSGETQ